MRTNQTTSVAGVVGDENIQSSISLRSSTKRMSLFVALAIGAAVTASTPAWALELSIYGVGHLSADGTDDGITSSEYIHSNSSRLGFKGSHDVGSGLSVLFQYESGVDLTGNGTGDGNGGCGAAGTGCNGQLFTRARDSFTGIKGSFGTLLLGRFGGLNQWLYDYNLFGDQIGDLGNIWGGDGLPGRISNAASYRSPDFSGFSAGLTYSPDQGVNDAAAQIIKADYANGGLKLGGAYASFGNGANVVVANRNDTKVNAITGSYDFGAFNLGGGWQRETDIGGVSNADRDKYTLGAAAKVGAAGTVKVQYASAGDLDNAVNSGSKQWAVGYDHAWDKNATLYIAYAKTKNDTGAAYSAVNYGHGDNGVPGIVAGRDPSSISIGLVYKFNESLFPRK